MRVGMRRMLTEFDESILFQPSDVSTSSPSTAVQAQPQHRSLADMTGTLVMPAIGFTKAAASSASFETYPIASSALSLLLASPTLPSPLGFGDDLTSSYFKSLLESSGSGSCSFGVDMQLNFKQTDTARDTSLMKLKAEVSWIQIYSIITYQILGSVSSSSKQCNDQPTMHISVADFEIQVIAT